MTNTVTETKAQKSERLKRAMNPWDGLAEIRRFARDGFESIPPEWIGTYFRWWGVYTQGDGAGVVGGQGGQGKALPFFMLRIRIPNGLLRSDQLRTIADLTRRYARGTADLTVRQNIQLHWVTIEDLPEVLEQLWRVDLNTTGACGDVTRNITGCPVAGVDADEICDASSLALEVDRMLAGNAEFYNLPRKFKISITGCRVWCPYPEINDVGLTAIKRVVRGKAEIGFGLRVGGGLSTEPYLGVPLNAFVRWNQVLPVVKGVAELFRDSEPLREHRERARLKFLFLRHGWTPGDFQKELERRLGFQLDSAEPEHPPADVYRDHIGIHPQKQAGYCYVGSAVVARKNHSRTDGCGCRPSRTLCRRRVAHYQHAKPTHRERTAFAGRRAGKRVRRDRTARKRLAVFSRRRRLQWQRVLQACHYRDQSFFALAGRGTGRAPSWF